MKFFLDTANLNEIREAASWGAIDGVTTNPTLMAREGRVDFKEHIRTICTIVNGPVSAEVVATDTEGMLREARDIAQIHPHVMVKIPCTVDGLKAIRILSEEGIKINTTLIFTAPQALLAAKAGATVVSPFVGRLDDISHQGMALIEQIRQIFDNYNFPTQILIGSVRHPMHVVEGALIGADIATMPFKVLQQLVKHPLTDIGLERFLKDWEKVFK
ncbi:MAG: fructose-6-phosphate aldolase [Acidobacteria bacterium]|nr:MAG: fructose-6-phosphate aldolase [Acidobacteriota bacterium]